MNIFRDPFLLVAFGFGSGLSPKAPGTAGTLLAIPIYLMLTNLDLSIYIAFVVIASIVGIWICNKASQRLGVHDHGGIVWDEIVGFWITMAGIPASLLSVTLGFLLFRLFDILKPWPIGLIDRQVGGGLGIMLDDIAAGAMAWLILWIAHSSNFLV